MMTASEKTLTNTIGQRMIHAIRLANDALADESRQTIIDFILAQQNPDGGFRGRSDVSDLYYTQFALQCLEGLKTTHPLPKTETFLASLGDGSDLDLVHTTCLARCLSSPLIKGGNKIPVKVFERINTHHLAGGGYRLDLEVTSDSIYATFLADLAHQDWNVTPKNLDEFYKYIGKKKSKDGGFADQSGLDSGTTPVTAAAAMLLNETNTNLAPDIMAWLTAQWFHAGGFLATPNAPIPDLLSTSTALFALKTLGADISLFEDKTMKFIEYVWDDSGGFCGHIADSVADCEYTFYGLITLGLFLDAS